MRFVAVLMGVFFLFACKEEGRLEKALYMAGENKVELFKVLEHYKQSPEDSLKLKAASFLIENMPGHGSAWSESIDSFRQRVNASDSLVWMNLQDEWWNQLHENNHPVFHPDVEYLSADFLIRNIDKAFDVWDESPWKADVDFDAFCRYILPYRFEQELLADGWRDSLYNEFHFLVEDVKSVKTAYEIVHDTVWKRLLSSYSFFPHSLDVVAIRHLKQAACNQRSLMLGSVMRALGIPAAMDCVQHWANYGHNGHAWVSLVTREGTYSIYEDEWEAKINNRIDATIVKVNYEIAEDYPLPAHFKKRYSKIWRSTFEHQDNGMDDSPFTVDVSAAYGLDGEITLRTDEKISDAYLCGFSTKNGWEPICRGKVEDNRCTFSALGDSVVYLVMGRVDNKLVPLENPVLLANHETIMLHPDKSKLREVKLIRKYPILGKWINKWASMVGGRFEGSNDPDFKQPELLYRIEKMPVFYNVAEMRASKEFRYIRFVAPADCDGVMSEIAFMGGEEEFKAIPGESSIKNVELSLDRNMQTHPEYKKGFVAGYDLGKPQKVTSIVYYPCNDDNFVFPGHEYELFYYDKDWISLGKQTAETYSLTYRNVPDNALLYLKDCTMGKEERPFTYINGQQVWW